jgi:hypothetical protein
MPKNIVICCDEWGFANSNVIKLYFATRIVDEHQVSFYHPGISSASFSVFHRITNAWKRLIRQFYGYGLMADLAECYRFLMSTYEQGDRVFVFGFSRGGATAQALVSMLGLFGLLPRGHEKFVPEICRQMQSWPAEGQSLWRDFTQECRVHFLGLWDAVGPKTYSFLVAVKADIVRHAVSIDERRTLFRPILLSGQEHRGDIKEVWFAGSHLDVGGGYTETDSGLAKISLDWMLGEVTKCGLIYLPDKIRKVLGHSLPIYKLSGHNDDLKRRMVYRFWGLGPDPMGPLHVSSIVFGKRRHIPLDSAVHRSVTLRIGNDSAYRPSNFKREFRTVRIEEGSMSKSSGGSEIVHHDDLPNNVAIEEILHGKASTRVSSAIVLSELLSEKVLQQRVVLNVGVKMFTSVWEIPQELANQITTDNIRIIIGREREPDPVMTPQPVPSLR